VFVILLGVVISILLVNGGALTALGRYSPYLVMTGLLISIVLHKISVMFCGRTEQVKEAEEKDLTEQEKKPLAEGR